ncbi:unnamed protein product [Merluccius merluccius]
MSDQPVNILVEMLRSMAEMQRDKMGALHAAAQTQVLAELVPWLAGIAALRPPQSPSIRLYKISVEDDLEAFLEAFKVATGAGGWLVEEWAGVGTWRGHSPSPGEFYNPPWLRLGESNAQQVVEQVAGEQFVEALPVAVAGLVTGRGTWKRR